MTLLWDVSKWHREEFDIRLPAVHPWLRLFWQGGLENSSVTNCRPNSLHFGLWLPSMICWILSWPFGLQRWKIWPVVILSGRQDFYLAIWPKYAVSGFPCFLIPFISSRCLTIYRWSEPRTGIFVLLLVRWEGHCNELVRNEWEIGFFVPSDKFNRTKRNCHMLSKPVDLEWQTENFTTCQSAVVYTFHTIHVFPFLSFSFSPFPVSSPPVPSIWSSLDVFVDHIIPWVLVQWQTWTRSTMSVFNRKS